MIYTGLDKYQIDFGNKRLGWSSDEIEQIIIEYIKKLRVFSK